MDIETFNSGPQGKTANIISIYKFREKGLNNGMVIV